MLYDVKQFKLSSGEELICDVIEWCEEGFKELVVRNAMKIASFQSENGDIFYTFKPWMHYLENNEDIYIINSDHVIGTATPNESLVVQYRLALMDMHRTGISRKVVFNEQKRQYLKDSAKAIEDLLTAKDEEIEDFFGDSDDPRGNNIINFPFGGKDKIH